MSTTAESIDVRITGDASGATGAMERVGSAVASAVGVMTDRLSALGLVSRNSMGEVGESSLKAAAEVEKSDTIIGHATERMRLHFLGVTESVEIMKGKFELAAGAIEAFNGILLGVGAILAGGALFKESIGAAVNLVTETNRLASVYGITLEKASGLHEALHTLGIGSDEAASMAMKLSRSLRTNEELLNANGIATRDAAGKQLNLLEIQTNVINRLREMEPGLQRNKLAIDAFGRGAGDLTKLLRLNDDAMREGMETAKALGIVVTKDGVESTVAYQHSVAEAKSVIEALWTAVGQALIPVIKELADMLKNNGKSAVDTMREAIVGVINAVRGFIAALATLDIGISVVAGAVAGFASIIGTLGHILGDVFTLNWSAIAADWKAGLADLDQIAKEATDRIASDWATSNMGPIGGPKSTKDMLLDAYKHGLGGGDEANPNTGDQAVDKTKKPKKAKEDPSRVPEFENQLAARKLALDQQNDAENTFREMSKAAEAKYWQDILARTDLSAKERTEVERKYLDASLAAKKESFAAMIAKEQEALLEAKGNGEARIALAKKIAAQTAAAYGEGSVQAEAALREVTRVTQEEAAKQARVAAETAERLQIGQLAVVDAAAAAAKHRTELGLQTETQLLAQERDLENQRYAILVTGIQARIAAAKLDPTTSAETVARLNKDLEALDVAHQAALTKNLQQAELQRTQIQRTGITSLSTGWGEALAKMATLQAGFATTIRSLWQGLVGAITQALSSMIQQQLEDWLTSLLVKKAATSASNVASVASYSALAGAAGVASMAGAPFPLDLGAPEFGASMASAALSFAAPASAMGGWDVPGSVGPGVDGRGGMSAIIHPREMVLPADLADKVRNGGGGGSGGGDTHNYHYSPTLNHHDGDLKKLLEREGGNMRRWMKNEARNNRVKAA